MLQTQLTRGRWTRPSDKMAVYTEMEPGRRWGIRVTLYPDSALVEAIEGPKCSWYQAPKEIAQYVKTPSFLERLRGVSFETKVLAEVETKRIVAVQKEAGDN